MKKRLSHEEISSVCMELALLLHAGVGLGDALSLLSQEPGRPDGPLLSAMTKSMDQGLSLSASMKEAGVFPAYVCGLVEVGEQAGRTEEALTALANYYEERVRMDRRIKSALLYPAVMLGLMLVVIAVLLVKVLPIFDDVYASLGGQLTGLAGGLLRLGRWLDKAMPALWAVLALAAVFFVLFSLAEPFRNRILTWWQRRRGDKGISRKMNTARLAQALAMCMACGLPTEEAVELSAGLMDDTPPAKARCLDCRKRLDQGESVSSAMNGSGLLPPAQCRLLELGQRSGTSDTAMEKIAQGLSEESEATLEAAVSRVEPALVLICSLLVGVILLSVMLPLMHIMSAIG